MLTKEGAGVACGLNEFLSHHGCLRAMPKVRSRLSPAGFMLSGCVVVDTCKNKGKGGETWMNSCKPGCTWTAL